MALYAIIIVDKRFHIPNGSHGPGDYSGKGDADLERKTSFVDGAINEEQMFDDQPGTDEKRSRGDLETGNMDNEPEDKFEHLGEFISGVPSPANQVDPRSSRGPLKESGNHEKVKQFDDENLKPMHPNNETRFSNVPTRA